MHRVMATSTSSGGALRMPMPPRGMWHGYRFVDGFHMKGCTTVLELESGERVLCDAVSSNTGHLEACNVFEYVGYGRDVTAEVTRDSESVVQVDDD